MIHVILGAIINLFIISPVVLLTLNDKTRQTFNSLIAFCAFYLINTTLLYLPLEFKHLIIIDGKWNWTGKIFAILGSSVFIMFYKRFDSKNYYLKLNQHPSFIQKGILVVLLIQLFKCITNYYFGSSLNGSFETILFQSTVPGLDEEIAYRGIMLGLLSNVLSPFRMKIFHPAIIVKATLFGLVHGLVVTQSFELYFDIFPFLNSFVLGIIWGWLTIRSGSILLSLISHNLFNVPINLIFEKIIG
jgi:membrane protease YdiL (CAAX protease family)